MEKEELSLLAGGHSTEQFVSTLSVSDVTIPRMSSMQRPLGIAHCSHHASVIFYNLLQFLRLFLSFLTLTSLQSTGQVFVECFAI